jgi:hypothetical protein
MSCVSISAISQTKQTTIIENDWLRNAVKLIEKGKIDAERVSILNQRIAILDGIIKAHTEKDTAVARVIETYQDELINLTNQRDIAVKEMKAQNKKFRRQKRKTVFATIGAAGVTAAIFIFLK